jgi:hypothetical protein
MKFKERLNQLASLLQQDTRIEVTQFECSSEISNSEWVKLQKGTPIDGIPFPQPTGDIIRDINGYHLEWLVRDKGSITPYEEGFPEEIFGRICLYDPVHLVGMYVFGEWKDTLEHHSESDNPNEPLKLIPFDYYHPDYSGCACFEIKNSTINQDIIFHSSRFGVYYSSLKIEEYLSLLIATGGMLGSREGLFFSEGLERHKMLHYIPQIFPKSPIRKIVSNFDAKNRY